MTAFSSVSLTPAPFDPSKHVSFTLGMVLGVDDFGQEFTYHAERDRWAARDLVGAGTVRGLGVSIQIVAAGPEVIVQPGVAITPQGEIVRVATAQCALLSDWVTGHASDVNGKVVVASPATTPATGTLPLYVILRYKPTLSDLVPIPGEPCRTEDHAMAPSRVTDDFQLDLSIAPPAATEEPGMRALVQWLSKVPIVTGVGSGVGAVLTALRTAFAPTPPPAVPPPLPNTPPAGLTIGAATAEDTFRAALFLYTTDLRDAIARAVPPDALPTETGLLLAKLTLPMDQKPDGSWEVTVAPSAPAILADATRSFLVPSDLVKEAAIVLLARSAAASGTTSTGPASTYRTAAAGLIAIKATSSPPDAGVQFGSLAAFAIAAGGGDVTVSFVDPSPPANTRYVVKALVMATGGLAPSVMLKTQPTAAAQTFTLHLSAGGTDVPIAVLTTQQLMIEISAYVQS